MNGRAFDVHVARLPGVQCVVFADDKAEAEREAALVLGSSVFGTSVYVFDPCELPAYVQVVYQGVCRARGQREWLVVYEGMQVHVYEEEDTLFPQLRFHAAIPGVGGCGWTLWQAVCQVTALRRQDHDPEWFTTSLRAGKAYYPTGYRVAPADGPPNCWYCTTCASWVPFGPFGVHVHTRDAGQGWAS